MDWSADKIDKECMLAVETANVDLTEARSNVTGE